LIDDKPFTGVTEKLAKKSKSDRPQRDKRGPRTDRPARTENTERKPRTERAPRERTPRTPADKSAAPVVQLPVRPVAKRLKPNRKHRSAVLQSLPVEQRSVAERALAGGIRAVREAIKTQNAQLKADGKPEVKADGLISMAQDILPKLRVAEWLDKQKLPKVISRYSTCAICVQLLSVQTTRWLFATRQRAHLRPNSRLPLSNVKRPR
jgi:hypothetical protein